MKGLKPADLEENASFKHYARPAKYLAALFLISLHVAASTAIRGQATRKATVPYKDPQVSVPERVSDLLHRMTLDEKLSMLSGSGWMESTGVPRLGIPQIRMSDGPMGIRTWTGPSAITNADAAQKFSSTAFPAGINLAATWDPELAREEGQAIGQEVAAVGRDMILGPTVNIQRAPLWGRNFESFGEDPYLSGKMAVGYIKGVQGEGILASVKHFAANNQEFERHRIDVTLDDRALHEIYFPAFEMAIKEAHVWTVMSSYNKVNGTYMAESPLLKEVLYREFGFKGFVVSDWGSTYSSAATVNAGMALEMPGGLPMRQWLARENTRQAGNDGGYLVPEKTKGFVQNGSILLKNVDQNVGRILTVIFESGLFDRPHKEGGAVDTAAQRALARRVAEEGIVLLKNENKVLPLDQGRVHSVAVIGPSAAVGWPGGGGSGLVYSKNVVTPLQGIMKRARGIQVHYAMGVAMQGEDAEQTASGSRKELLDAAVSLAKAADVAVLFVGYSSKLETEGYDRPNMGLPDGQDQLIQAVSTANRNTIVVLNAGDSVDLTTWIDHVPGLIDAWYGGEEGGSAIADVLFGDANPSGKLPFTFLRKLEDSPSYANYPGKDLHVNYGEGIYVGYRYFDKHEETAPLFPFGFGLSYTSFAVSKLELPKVMRTSDKVVTVKATVKNTGERSGAEVIQLYVSEPNAPVDRPLRELKGFQRVELAPKESKVVSFTLDRRSLSFYSVAEHRWKAQPGLFDISVGTCSRDLPLKDSFTLQQ